MSNLPDIPRRHFNLKVNDPVETGIFEYCINGLLIPSGHLSQFEKVQSMDSYWVYTMNGCRFMISGPELREWETRCECGNHDKR